MARLGLTNLYLKVGLGLILLGVVLGLWLFTQPASGPPGGTVSWIARASFLGGIVLYVIGRASQVLRRTRG